MLPRRNRGQGQSVIVAGASGEARDDIAGQVIFIDFVHHEVHEGSTFQASYKTPDASPRAGNAQPASLGAQWYEEDES